MGKVTGFIEFKRELPKKRPATERVHDYREFYLPFPEERIRNQAARCMDCGVPTCHAGCPLGNLIPDWNDLVYNNLWKDAIDRLHATNNFPEFTGRLCPAPCEEACVLAINEPAVTIEEIEKQIVERAFSEGWVLPIRPQKRTMKKVAVIGSGPAGLAAAQQLNRAGHFVTVYERDPQVGGLLRYGIPDFKMEKWVIDRRSAILEAEGITFKTNADLGNNIPFEELKEYDAIVLAIGATAGRDLPVEGRDLAGIELAMRFLARQNKMVAGEALQENELLNAKGKHVIVIGGGDTGSDCIGTSNRQGALSVTNFELLPQPPEGRSEEYPWPFWPMRMRTSTSHEEGVHREWSINTKKFIGSNGRVKTLVTNHIELVPNPNGGRPQIREIPGTEKEWPADLVLLALGFTGPEKGGLVEHLGVELDDRGNIKTNDHYVTSQPHIFAAGDGRRGQSLIVWAISEGREAARNVDLYLMGKTELPTKGEGDLPRA
jgi:glutamate synthase (NADPH/NADH) small chain